ncbi:MAG: hypothetical protein M3010_00765 [Candidatus Dormibacteraeota bacterium]|nr:hypothetical protein [Candidatus Dormibacteraeota bacterium]
MQTFAYQVIGAAQDSRLHGRTVAAGPSTAFISSAPRWDPPPDPRKTSRRIILQCAEIDHRLSWAR